MRYAAASGASKIGILNTLLDPKLKETTEIRNRVAVLKSRFKRSDARRNHVEEPVRAAILFSSPSMFKELASIIVSVNISKEETAT